MKKLSQYLILVILLLFTLQSHAQVEKTKITLFIEGKPYPVQANILNKIDGMWIKSMEITKNSKATNIYIKEVYKKNCLAAIGVIDDDNVYQTVDCYPAFRYADCKDTDAAIQRYVKKNYKLPAGIAKPENEEKIYIYAIVEKSGKLSECKVNKGGNVELNQSIIQFLKEMPKWIPAKIKDENVRYRYLITINANSIQ